MIRKLLTLGMIVLLFGAAFGFFYYTTEIGMSYLSQHININMKTFQQYRTALSLLLAIITVFALAKNASADNLPEEEPKKKPVTRDERGKVVVNVTNNF